MTSLSEVGEIQSMYFTSKLADQDAKSTKVFLKIARQSEGHV